MVNIEPDKTRDIIKRVVRMEEILSHKMNTLENLLRGGEDTFQLFRDGLRAQKERHLHQLTENPIKNIQEKIFTDKELGHPHKKIMQSLMDYDYQKQRFKEKNFSKLVKDAQVGKNKANEYLEFLRNKNYLQKRSDGYRHHYQIRDEKKFYE